MRRRGRIESQPSTEIDHAEVKPPLDLPIGLLGKADCAGLGDALNPRRDIDAVAHEIAVGFLDDVAQMNSNAELNRPIFSHAGASTPNIRRAAPLHGRLAVRKYRRRP